MSDVRVAARGVDEVVPADAVGVPIAVDHDHVQVRVGELRSLCERQRPPVQRQQPVSQHIVRQLRSAADAGDDQHLVRRQIKLRQGALDGVEHAEVAAARAPRGLDVSLVQGDVDSFSCLDSH